MVGTRKDHCSICRIKKLRLFSPHEQVVEKELLAVIESVSGVKVANLKPPVELLICTECAVALIQAETVVAKLQRALGTLSHKHKSDDRSVAQPQNNSKYKRIKLEPTECVEDDTENESTENNSKKTKLIEDPVSTTKSIWKFKCEQCEYETKHAKFFKKHLLSKHQLDDPRIYKCNSCPETYQRLYALQNHIAYVHENKPRPPQRRKSVAVDLLSDGNLKFDRDHTMTEETFNESHDTTMISNNLTTYYFECDHCKYATENAKLFKRHLLLKHQIEKPRIYECQLCSSSYQRLYALRNHVAFVHEKKPRPTPQRRKSVPPDFSKDETLGANAMEWSAENEILSHEQNDRGNIQIDFEAYKCELCPYEGDNAKHLQKHISVIHQINTLEKNELHPNKHAKESKNKSELKSSSNTEGKQLLKSKSEWVFSCGYCDFETNKKKQYKSHLLLNHQIDDGCIYKCEYCSASFERYPRLEDHIERAHNVSSEMVGAGQTNGQSRNSVEDNDSELHCHYSDCNKHFRKPAKLHQHFIKKHTNTSFVGEKLYSS